MTHRKAGQTAPGAVRVFWQIYCGTPLRWPNWAAEKMWAEGNEHARLGFAVMPNRHILTKGGGGPVTNHDMVRVMIAQRKRLDPMAFDQHALRYRGVMEQAWAGCDDDEIASYSGHTSKAMIRKYAAEVRQIMRARQAAAKRI